VIRSKPLPLSLVNTRTLKLSVKFPCDKLENQLNLQDGDIDHRQHAGIHSAPSQKKVQTDRTTVGNSNVDKFVITDKWTTIAIHNQKHSSFSISSATCYYHMMFHQTPPPPGNADTLPRLDTT